MKNIILLIALTFTVSLFSQKNYNTKKGVIVKGYDVVAYFNNNAIKGSTEFSTKHKNVTFLFSSITNKQLFDANPEKYSPQYGGYCAYALGASGKKVSVNPETFEIRDGKLYLFYNKGKTNTLKLWQKEGADDLQKKADLNWSKIINEK